MLRLNTILKRKHWKKHHVPARLYSRLLDCCSSSSVRWWRVVWYVALKRFIRLSDVEINCLQDITRYFYTIFVVCVCELNHTSTFESSLILTSSFGYKISQVFFFSIFSNAHTTVTPKQNLYGFELANLKFFWEWNNEKSCRMICIFYETLYVRY